MKLTRNEKWLVLLIMLAIIGLRAVVIAVTGWLWRAL